MKVIFAFLSILIISIGVTFAMNGSDSFTVSSGEGVVLSFPKKVESINFSHDSGFTIRTLEGGQWIDMSDDVSDYYPLRGYLIRNSGTEDLIIDVDYAMLSSVEETLFQKDLPAGWNLVGVAYKDDHFGRVASTEGLGESLPYSQVIDFTGKDFPDHLISGEAIPMNQIDDNNISIKSKSELLDKNLFERIAYGVFVNVDTAISGTQKIDESQGISGGTSFESAEELARLGIIPDHSDDSILYRLADILTGEELSDFIDSYSDSEMTVSMTGVVSKIDGLRILMESKNILIGTGSLDQNENIVDSAVDKGIAISFSDYDTDVTRGQFFKWAVNILIHIEYEAEDEYVSELLSNLDNDEEGDSEVSTDEEVLPIVENVIVVRANNTDLTLSWDPIDDAGGYLVYYQGENDDILKYEYSFKSLQTISWLTFSETYYMSIVAIDDNLNPLGASDTLIITLDQDLVDADYTGQGDFSDIENFQVTGATSTGVTLSWDPVDNAIIYLTYTGQDNEDISTFEYSTEPGKIFSGLTYSDTYNIHVIAMDAEYNVLGLSEVFNFTLNEELLDSFNTESEIEMGEDSEENESIESIENITIENFEVVRANNTDVTLSWDVVDDALGYLIYYQGVNDDVVRYEDALTSLQTISGLTFSDTYYMYVLAIDDEGNDLGISDILTFTLDQDLVDADYTGQGDFSDIENFQVTGATSTGVTLSWDPIDDTLIYGVYYKTNNETVSQAEFFHEPSLAISGLTYADTYNIHVIATDEENNVLGLSEVLTLTLNQDLIDSFHAESEISTEVGTGSTVEETLE